MCLVCDPGPAAALACWKCPGHTRGVVRLTYWRICPVTANVIGLEKTYGVYTWYILEGKEADTWRDKTQGRKHYTYLYE